MVQDNKPNMRKETLSQVAASVPTRPRNYRVEYQRQQQRANLGCGFAVVVALGLVSVGIYGAYEAVNPTKDVTVTVTDKVVKNSKNDSTYLIFTDKGVFEDSDSLINGKWNSSDLYNELKVGKTYTLHVRGIRNHVLSWYPNILTVKPVK